MLKKVISVLGISIIGFVLALPASGETVSTGQGPMCNGTAQHFVINNQSGKKTGVFISNKIHVQTDMPKLFYLPKNQNSIIFKNEFVSSSSKDSVPYIMTAIAATTNPETMLCEITFRCECSTTSNGKSCTQFVKTVGSSCTTGGGNGQQSPVQIDLS